MKNINPSIRIECTDYMYESLERLKNVFTKMDQYYRFDMLNDDYNMIEKDKVILMYRASTEFNYNQWCDIFDKIYEAKIKNIIFVPSELCTDVEKENAIKHHEKLIAKGKEDIFCGWLYSEEEFLKMFSGGRDKEL